MWRKQIALSKTQVYHDMEGLSVEGPRCPLWREILGSSSLWFMEAAGATLVRVQKEPYDPHQRHYWVSCSFQWKRHSESRRA